jgi:hypothetical protein
MATVMMSDPQIDLVSGMVFVLVAVAVSPALAFGVSD